MALTELPESQTRDRLQHYIDFAIEALHTDRTLRVPRSQELRKDGFAEWRNLWRDRLAAAIQTEFQNQFLEVEANTSTGPMSDASLQEVWHQVESELMAFALEGLARSWVRRRMGDAILIKRPRLEGTNWIVPLGIQGDEADLGQVVLDRDGNIIEELSSSRSDLLARIHG